MKHITEEYGQETNIMQSTLEEYHILKNFLTMYGIEVRMISIIDNTVEWQIRNGYKDWAHLYSNDNITGQKIIDIVEDNIKSGSWCR